MKRGRKQLASTPASKDAIKLIFLFFAGPNADMFVRRTLYTFYGVQDLTPISHDGNGVNCVYFHNSFAYSSPNIDGLVVMENEYLQLCLNEFSTGYQRIRKSKLVKAMGKAIYDPTGFDADIGKIVLRSDVPRKDEKTVLEELERLTGVKYTTITLHRYNL